MSTLTIHPWVCEDSPFMENETQLDKILRAAYPDVAMKNGIEYSAVIPEAILQKRGDTGSPNIFVDARIESLNMVVFLDTIEDYTEPLRIVHTQHIDRRLKDMGYSVIHIPFFIQMNAATSKHFFGVELDIECKQASGFYYSDDSKPNEYVPARFCSIGWNRFIEQVYSAPPNIYLEIMNSLKAHAEQFGQELTTICFPLGLECKTCPAHKQQEDLKTAWAQAAHFPKAPLQ